MKRRLSFVACVSAVALSALPLSAQVPALQSPTAVAIPAPAPEVAGSFLNPLHQEEWVVLDEHSAVHGLYAQLNSDGSTRGVERVSVQLSRNGVPIQTTVTEPDGHFVLPGVGPGTYALIAKSAGSVAAFALHVLPNGASQRLDSNFVVYGTSMGGPAVLEMLRSHAVPTANVSGYYPDLKSDPLGDNRRFGESAQIQLRSGNVLAGQVSRPNGVTSADMSGNVVHLFSKGRVVGQGTTNGDGGFQIANVKPGVYDIIVAGKDGIAAVGFRAVGEVALSSKTSAGSKLVSVNQPAGDALNLELVTPTDYFVDEGQPVIDEAGIVPIPGGGFVGPGGFAGGGGGGFGGGGGGGGLGGGGGGLGALLGIGGLAAGVVALASDDDGFDSNQASRIVQQ